MRAETPIADKDFEPKDTWSGRSPPVKARLQAISRLSRQDSMQLPRRNPATPSFGSIEHTS
jgi:hypothetical protein